MHKSLKILPGSDGYESKICASESKESSQVPDIARETDVGKFNEEAVKIQRDDSNERVSDDKNDTIRARNASNSYMTHDQSRSRYKNQTVNKSYSIELTEKLKASDKK